MKNRILRLYDKSVELLNGLSIRIGKKIHERKMKRAWWKKYEVWR